MSEDNMFLLGLLFLLLLLPVMILSCLNVNPSFDKDYMFSYGVVLESLFIIMIPIVFIGVVISLII